jgi:DNA-binding transcriptional ArsR family regulator
VLPFAVLAEPARRRILDLLRERPRLVGELSAELGLSQPGTSKHLRVLREAGLVEAQVDAQRRRYALRPEPLAELDAWLAPYRRLWDRRLDALERELDRMPDPDAGPDAPDPVSDSGPGPVPDPVPDEETP